MSNSNQNPEFIHPVDREGIFYMPTEARYIMSEKPVKRGTILKMGQQERSIKYSEELTMTVYPSSGRLRITKGFMQITSEDGLKQFIKLLGFNDRRSFLMATFSTFTTDGAAAQRKLIIHHLYDDTVLPPL